MTKYHQATVGGRGGRKALRHVLIAERALGKHLPPRAEVHHVDENKRNNANSNLVICQDRRYHKWLHLRAMIVRAGGNPNTEALCPVCRRVKPRSDFSVKSASVNGLTSYCRSCMSTWRKGKQSASVQKELLTLADAAAERQGDEKIQGRKR
jgi:hypothetical protein